MHERHLLLIITVSLVIDLKNLFLTFTPHSWIRQEIDFFEKDLG